MYDMVIQDDGSVVIIECVVDDETGEKMHVDKDAPRKVMVGFDHELPALNVGAGSHYILDWINMERYKDSGHHTGKTANPDVYGDAHHLPFSDKSFKTVYCRQVLEHLTRPMQALEEFYRVLGNSGLLRVELPDPSRCGSERDDHLYSWSEDTIKNILEYVGFDIKRYWKIGKGSHIIEVVK